MTHRSDPPNALRSLLRLFPSGHRERFGSEMWEVVRYRWGQRRGGRWGVVWCVVALAADLVWTAARIRVAMMAGWMMGGWKGMGLDARYVLRGLARSKGFAFTVVAVLGIAVAVNTAVFSFIQGTLLDQPPYEDPGSLVFVWGSNPANGQLRDVISGSNYIDLADRTRTLAGIAAVHSGGAMQIVEGRPVVMQAVHVTSDFFDVLGVSAALGSTFGEEDRMSGGRAGVVVSDAYWRDALGGSADVVGSTLELDGVPRVVLGVLPADFRFAGTWPLFLPLHDDDLAAESRSRIHFNVLGRLAPGASAGEATRELSAVFSELSIEYPQVEGWSVLVEPMGDVSVEAVRPALWLLALSVLLVLAVATVNLGALFRIRILEHGSEVGLRAALGAPRRRLASLVLLEAVGLALLGGLVGLALAPLALEALSSLAPPLVLIPDSAVALPVLRATLSPGVRLGALGIALAAGVVLAVPSLWTVVRMQVVDAVGRTGRRVQRGLGSRWLVGAELALATMLCVGAALTVRSSAYLAGADVGVEPEGILSLYFGSPSDMSPAERADYHRQVVAAVERVPGVRSVGLNDYRPFQGEDDFHGILFLDRPPPESGRPPREEWRRVSEGLFETVGMRVVQGRGFGSEDFVGKPQSVVINEAFARKYYPGGDPVGKRLTVYQEGYQEVEVIGVVADVPQSGPTVPTPPVLYAPHQAAPRDHVALFAKVDGVPMSYVEQIQEAVWSVGIPAPIYDVAPFAEVVRQSRAVPTMLSRMVAGLAAIALLLAALGVFGVVGYAVRNRTREMGVRLALGATASVLERQVVLRLVPVLVVALAGGLVLAAGLARLLETLLFGVGAFDPVAFVSAGLLVTAIAVVATWLPARRVAAVDPARVILDG